ncbi:hypothetical protein BURMUCGD1_6170 [Burkholderia multivorans CGD1]|nr:hypothetical protein BURMUCGD1_6170 [Burkholderia multivorans CGD1]
MRKLSSKFPRLGKRARRLRARTRVTNATWTGEHAAGRRDIS